jgi:hypothetical protein
VTKLKVTHNTPIPRQKVNKGHKPLEQRVPGRSEDEGVWVHGLISLKIQSCGAKQAVSGQPAASPTRLPTRSTHPAETWETFYPTHCKTRRDEQVPHRLGY